MDEPRRVARDQDVRRRRVGRAPALRILLDDAQHVDFRPHDAAADHRRRRHEARVGERAARSSAASRAARGRRASSCSNMRRRELGAAGGRTTTASRSDSRAPGATSMSYSSAPKMRRLTNSASRGVTSSSWRDGARALPPRIACSSTCSRSDDDDRDGSREPPHQRAAPRLARWRCSTCGPRRSRAPPSPARRRSAGRPAAPRERR